MRFTDLALILRGATSGEQIIKTAAAASGAITLPAGTMDFSATGGTSQVVKQTTAGGAFTVGQVAATEVSGLAGLTANALIKGGGAGAAPVVSTATVDGSGFMTVNGQVTSTGSSACYNFADRVTPANLWIWYANSGSAYLDRGGTKLAIDATGSLTVANSVSCTALLASDVLHAIGTECRPGQAGPGSGNIYNINFGTGSQLWIGSTNTGTITVSSDYRIKENVAELPSMWAKVKALRPISYTIKDYDIFRKDRTERWGFVAHELQETLIESAASGKKDAPNLIQSPDIMTVLATATKALQEAMARIEALEAALSARDAPTG